MHRTMRHITLDRTDTLNVDVFESYVERDLEESVGGLQSMTHCQTLLCVPVEALRKTTDDDFCAVYLQTCLIFLPWTNSFNILYNWEIRKISINTTTKRTKLKYMHMLCR